MIVCTTCRGAGYVHRPDLDYATLCTTCLGSGIDRPTMGHEGNAS